MHVYSMFLDSGAGAFGAVRTVWLWNDNVAVEIGRRMLNNYSGVDVWRDGSRVALLRREQANFQLAS